MLAATGHNPTCCGDALDSFTAANSLRVVQPIGSVIEPVLCMDEQGAYG